MPENLIQHTTELRPTAQERSEQERSERRRADRERLRDSAEQLLTPEGWMRWVQARATLRGYSSANCMLLAQQCHERGIVPERVGGLHAWRKLGRRVREDETALRMSAPIAFKLRDETRGVRVRRQGYRNATLLWPVNPGLLAGACRRGALPARVLFE